MLERIVAQVTVALIAWLDKRLSQSPVGVDAASDPDALKRAGARIDEWLRNGRKPNGVRPREQPDADRTKG